MHSISIIIPTLNRDETLLSVLRYLIDSKCRAQFEIIVIDQSDNPKPSTTKYITNNKASIKYKKVGFKNANKARNLGASLSRFDILLFIDDDIEPLPGFLEAHINGYHCTSVIGVTGPSPHPGRGLRSLNDVINEPIAVWQTRFDVNFDHQVAWALGCNLSFRRPLFFKIGGFDESFTGSSIGDDVDICFRATRDGGKIAYASKAHVIHHQFPSGGTRNITSYREKSRHNTSNFIYKWVTHGGWFVLLRHSRRFVRRTLLTNQLIFNPYAFILSCIGFYEGIRYGFEKIKLGFTSSLDVNAANGDNSVDS